MRISPNKSGLALGGLLGAFHLLWSLCVALGIGQMMLDFIFTLHMIHPVYTVGPFDVVTAGGLVVVTALVGYAFGFVFALFWNRAHRA